MTFRAVILGVLGAVLIATVGYFNDQIPRLEHFVGHQFPLAVFLPLFVLCAAVNPLLHRRGWRLKAGELAVMVAFWLVACNIPGSGLLRLWSRNVVMPMYYEQQRVGWQQAEALQKIPPRLLADDGQYDEKFINAVLSGEGREELVGPRDIPWHKWAGPIRSWMPLVAALAVASIALALMVHRAWADNERLPYPVAQLAVSVMESQPGQALGPVFRQRPFLVAAAIVFAVHLVNGANAWFEGKFEIPMSFTFEELHRAFPKLSAVPWGGNAAFHVRILPSVLAFAVFVADDVSFSLGISGIAMALAGAVAMEYGLGIEWITMGGGAFEWQVGGSAIAIGVMILYYGRRHYWSLLRGAFGASRGDARGYEVWACRVFLASMALAAALLVNLGLDWLLATLVVMLFMLGYLVFARINVESGLWLIQSKWQPLAMLIGFFGVKAMGLSAIALIGFLGIVFAIDIRECLMPMMLNGLQVCRSARLPTGRTAGWAGGVFLVALAAAVPFSIWVDHNWGIFGGEGWSTQAAPTYTFDFVTKQHNLLALSEQQGAGEGLSALERVAAMEPDPLAWKSVAIGFAAVIVLSVLRLRFRWWPIHPILLLVWGTWGMYETAGSFLLGWAVKKATLGLGVKYAKLKTFMIGAIAGDLAGGGLWLLAGAIRWAYTGQVVPGYRIFPGG